MRAPYTPRETRPYVVNEAALDAFIQAAWPCAHTTPSAHRIDAVRDAAARAVWVAPGAVTKQDK